MGSGDCPDGGQLIGPPVDKLTNGDVLTWCATSGLVAACSRSMRSMRSAQALAAVLVGKVQYWSLWPFRRTIARQRPLRFCSVAMVPSPRWHSGTTGWEMAGKTGQMREEAIALYG